MPQIKEKRTHSHARSTPYSVSGREPSPMTPVQKENSRTEAPQSQAPPRPWRQPTSEEMELFEYLLGREAQFTPPKDFLSDQSEIDHQMRWTLHNWLYDVANEIQFSVVTWFLTINFIDRYCTTQKVTRGKYQLVGITCLFIAMKFEERDPISYKSLAELCDNAYTPDEILLMESEILNKLDFNLSSPTPIDFISFLQKLWVRDVDSQTIYLTSYLTELAILDYQSACFRHSMICLASFILALTYSGRLWGRELAELFNLDSHSTNFHECLRLVGELWNNQSRRTTAIFAKYSNQQFRAVALLTPITL